MSVRAKFRVDGVEKQEDGSTIRLSPVIGGSEENDQFYRYTPGGNIILSTINQAAADQFVAGKEFYVDFTPAESPPA